MTVSRNVYIALGVLVALAVSFAFGRYTAPVKTEHHTEYLTRVQTVKTTHVQRITDTKWRRVIVTQPDGSSTTTESGETHESERTTENENSSTTAKEVTKHVTSYAPQWSLFVTPGVVFPTSGSNSGSPALTVGVEVHRRIAGPIWAGVWFRALGGPPSAGASVGLEF